MRSEMFERAPERIRTFQKASERLLVMFPNAISEVISELKSVREPSERISGGHNALGEEMFVKTSEHFSLLRRILIHWRNCKKDECLICKPIHEFHKKEDDDKKIVQAAIESKNPCVICLEDNPINPITCRNCKQLVGCSKCVLKWIRSTNMSELNRPSVLALASSNENHRCCPICRKRWRGTKDLIRTRTFPS
uniref:RING-type domain-containing protein n=1 Tax=Acrobeloides nanus TaxID=290746 RepID=A0A914DXE4_9BILA